MADLSFIIPARNEDYLRNTVEDILAHIKGDSEIIIVCDGEWPVEPLDDHPRVHMIYHPASVGQRGATNEGARISTAKYICKLDAHCGISDGFDVQMMADGDALGADVTQIPAMINLHLFDWECRACKHRLYQGPMPHICEKCKQRAGFEKIIVWKPRPEGHKRTEYWRFDHTLHFNYWADYKKRPEARGEIVDVMSNIGACFFLRRDRFLKLGGLDERHGSWGQVGTEVSCKAWLSGGRQIVNKRAWYSHLFRTQNATGADGKKFGFPYPLSDSQVERARKYSREMWFGNTFKQQVRPLSWLIEKFWPVPGWSDPEGAEALARVRAAGVAFRLAREQSLSVSKIPVVLTASEANHASLPSGHGMPVSTVGSPPAGPSGIILPLAGATDPHDFPGGSDDDRHGQKMPADTVSATAIDGGRSIGPEEIHGIADQLQVGRITATSVPTKMIKDGDVSPSTPRQASNQPCPHEPVSHLMGSVPRDPAIRRLVNEPDPIPTSGAVIHADAREHHDESVDAEVSGNREKLLNSHAEPASQVASGLGPGTAETASGPHILHRRPTIGYAFYSDCRGDATILDAVRAQLRHCATVNGAPIVSVTLAPVDLGFNRVLPLERGYLTMFTQQLLALETLDTDIVCMTEHDVLYHPSTLAYVPPHLDRYYYNQHVWKVSAETGHALHYVCNQVSGLCASRALLLEHYRRRVERVEREGFTRHMGFEPGTRKIRHGGIDDVPHETWMSPVPNLDIRHGANLTPSRWKREQFRNQKYTAGWTDSDRVPGWGITEGRFAAFLSEVGQ